MKGVCLPYVKGTSAIEHHLPHYYTLLFLCLLFVAALGTSLSLSGNVYRHLTVVTPALRTGAVRDTHVAALALNKRVCLKGKVRTVLARLRPVMSHPHNHAPTIANKGKKANPALVVTKAGS